MIAAPSPNNRGDEMMSEDQIAALKAADDIIGQVVATLKESGWTRAQQCITELESSQSLVQKVGLLLSYVYARIRSEWRKTRDDLEECQSRAADLTATIQAQAQRIEALEGALNTPELHDFAKGVVSEAQHQRVRHGAAHDAGKTAWDWFWLVGYLSQKAAAAHQAGDIEKAQHHTISTAAALANWHAQVSGHSDFMRPGIDPVARGIEPTLASATGDA